MSFHEKLKCSVGKMVFLQMVQQDACNQVHALNITDLRILTGIFPKHFLKGFLKCSALL